MDAGFELLDEVDRISKAITNHRWDYTEAIRMVIDAMKNFDPDIHRGRDARRFLREFVGTPFDRLKNQRAAIEAYDFLKKEKLNVSVEEQDSASDLLGDISGHCGFHRNRLGLDAVHEGSFS